MSYDQQTGWRRRRVVRGCLLLLLGACTTSAANGDLIIDLPDVVAYSDGFTPVFGVFEVTLTLTDGDLASPPSVSSFNLDFSVGGVQVFLGAPVTPPPSDDDDVADPLLVGGDFSSLTSGQSVKASHDLFSQSPSNAPAFNGARLVQVPYVVAPGLFASYPLSFGALNQVTNASATPLPVTLRGGSFLVAIVPEAAAWKSLALIGAWALLTSVAVRGRRTEARCNG